MTNHDRLLQFLYDTKHTRQDCLTDLRDRQLVFSMATYDNEKLVYKGNGGEKASLYVFTLKGRFKYSIIVDIPGAQSAGKNSRRPQGFSERFPGLGHSPVGPADLSRQPGPTQLLDDRVPTVDTPVDRDVRDRDVQPQP